MIGKFFLGATVGFCCNLEVRGLSYGNNLSVEEVRSCTCNLQAP